MATSWVEDENDKVISSDVKINPKFVKSVDEATDRIRFLEGKSKLLEEQFGMLLNEEADKDEADKAGYVV